MLAMSNANAIRSLARATGVARRAAPLFPIQISRASARHYAKHASLPANLREDNPSFVLHAVEKTSFDQRSVPTLKEGEVLVQIAKTGICGSDIHYLQHGRIGKFVLDKPMCLGHESSGTVVQLGSGVTDGRLKEGSRIAIEPYSPCRTCYQCKSGQYHLCPTHQFAATPPSTLGTLCRYYAVPHDMCHLLPDSVCMEDGAMMEPLAVGVHAVSTLGQFKSNESLVVFGAGPVGLLCMAVAKGLGARRVIAVDINEQRLDFAKGYAATDVFIPPKKEAGEDASAYGLRAADALREAFQLPDGGPGSISLAIEATGAPTCVQMGLHLLAPRGTYIQVGMGSNMNITLPLSAVGEKELKLIGSFRYGAGDYPLGISLVERGLVNLTPLRTHQYSFEDAVTAFETTANGKDKDGKPSIKCIIDAPL